MSLGRYKDQCANLQSQNSVLKKHAEVQIGSLRDVIDHLTSELKSRETEVANLRNLLAMKDGEHASFRRGAEVSCFHF